MDTLLNWLLATFAWPLLAVLGLAAVDVITGIGSALRRGQFDWTIVANFYRTTIVPKLVGWVGLTLLAYLATAGALAPETGDVVGQVAGYGGLGLVSVDLLRSIASNVLEIYRKE